jgi:TetR/AcrR family transcriptional regulator, cholesterol catabolism regulator
VLKKTQATRADEPLETRKPGDRKPREKRWSEILRAAAEVFHEKGYDAATLQDIADRVGILKGSIYYYIKTKGDLLDSLLIEVHKEGVAMIRERAATPGTIFDKLEAMIRGHVDYMCRHRAKAAVYLHELRALDALHRDSLFSAHDFRDEFLSLIQQGQREGLILAELEPKLTAQAMLAWINSLYHWYRPQPRKSYTLIAAHFVTTVLRGIASDEGLKLLKKQPVSAEQE